MNGKVELSPGVLVSEHIAMALMHRPDDFGSLSQRMGSLEIALIEPARGYRKMHWVGLEAYFPIPDVISVEYGFSDRISDVAKSGSLVEVFKEAIQIYFSNTASDELSTPKLRERIQSELVSAMYIHASTENPDTLRRMLRGRDIDIVRRVKDHFSSSGKKELEERYETLLRSGHRLGKTRNVDQEMLAIQSRIYLVERYVLGNRDDARPITNFPAYDSGSVNSLGWVLGTPLEKKFH
ncbi:hypothetical protein CMO93_01080 [Candidatus Woesearchaeota archaeon]|nr:hypothetical protein [Candidatus Woesearchaeota archaeon]|tara:strand:+ start:3566 stop:4279 length:714 start_codon:yes stop_codon:yes gene_type:complete